MATTFNIPSIAVHAGDNFLPPGGGLVPLGTISITVLIDVSTWPNTQTYALFAQWSLDGGTTWGDGPGVTGNCGVQHTRTGAVGLAGFVANIPNDQGQGVHARAHLTAPAAGRVSGSITLA